MANKLLRVMSIFEVGARLEMSSELMGLAAHVYHRFFRTREMELFELYTFAAASLKLAHKFYEQPFRDHEVCLVMINIIHGPNYYLSEESENKLLHSIDLAAKIIPVNLDFQINYKNDSRITPGELRERAAALNENKKQIVSVGLEQSSSENDDDNDDMPIPQTDQLLTNNDRNEISSHRYLVHYLKAISLLVKPEGQKHFKLISNLAWIILCDLHWTPAVTLWNPNHLACVSLIMAIEIVRPDLEKSSSRAKAELLILLNRKWNLILCDDLSDTRLVRAFGLIADQIFEYERLMQHEFSTYVIDPIGQN